MVGKTLSRGSEREGKNEKTEKEDRKETQEAREEKYFPLSYLHPLYAYLRLLTTSHVPYRNRSSPLGMTMMTKGTGSSSMGPAAGSWEYL